MHPSTIQQDFDKILSEGVWGDINGVGPGSNPEIAKDYIASLQNFLIDNKIESVVDAGCSFWNIGACISWECNYTGYDIYGPAIEYNTQRFATTKIVFRQGNVLEIDLPKADLLIVKDVIIHWFDEEVIRFIPQLSKYKYVLLTSTENTSMLTFDRNDCISHSIHRWAPINVTAVPFNLCAPVIWRNPVTRIMIHTGL